MEEKKIFSPRRLLLQVLFYAAGLLCLAFSVTFAVNSDLGLSPVNSLPYMLSRIFGGAMGNWVTGVFCGMILLQILLLRREFRLIDLTQILFSTLFGYFVTFATNITGDFCLPGYIGRLAMLCISICFIAVGLSLYVSAGLVPMPAEGLSLALAKKTPLAFHNAKVLVDCTSVSLAAVASFIAFGKLTGIGIGTVITALFAGKVVGLVKPAIEKFVHRIIS